ncbi:MAG: ribosome maturation factor RimM [Caulobacteraceae bacterium]
MLILVGRVAGAHGVKGEIRITAYTDAPMSLLAYSPLLDAEGAPALTLIGGRAVKGVLIARTEPPLTREAAQALRGLNLHMRKSNLPPTSDEEFYLVDLIGLQARAPDGTVIGKIRSVHDFGAGDLLEIEPGDGGPSWWAPFTRATAPVVRIDEGFIVVDRPDRVEAEP